MDAYIESTRKKANELLETARNNILSIKKARNLSYRDLANISGMSEDTIKNFCSGKTDKNTGYITVTMLAMSLNCDLNELVGYEPKKEIEANNIVPVIEVADSHIDNIVKAYESHIEDIKALCEIRISDLKQSYEERMKEQREMLSKL